jgi:hypothetical protein
MAVEGRTRFSNEAIQMSSPGRDGEPTISGGFRRLAAEVLAGLFGGLLGAEPALGGHADHRAGPRSTRSRDRGRRPGAGSCRRTGGRWRGRCSRTDGRRGSNRSCRLFHIYLRILRKAEQQSLARDSSRPDYYTIVVHISRLVDQAWRALRWPAARAVGQTREVGISRSVRANLGSLQLPGFRSVLLRTSW